METIDIPSVNGKYIKKILNGYIYIIICNSKFSHICKLINIPSVNKNFIIIVNNLKYIINYANNITNIDNLRIIVSGNIKIKNISIFSKFYYKINKFEFEQNINNDVEQNVQIMTTLDNKFEQNINNDVEQNVQIMTTLDNKFIFDNIDILFILQKIKNTNIYISLSVIPQRIVSIYFEKVLETLCYQKISAKKIIVNICKKYKRFDLENICDYEIKNAIDKYTKLFGNVIFNYSEDYGPITKIIGLIHSNIQFDDNDIIISVDDDFEMSNTLTYFYGLVHDLYNPDMVGVYETKLINWNFNNPTFNKFTNLFEDCFNKQIYGWLSFSFKYKYIKKLYMFYNEIIKHDENIWKHDDLIITCFYIVEKLYCCCMNIMFHKNFNNNHIGESKLSNYFGLKIENNIWSIRTELEKKIFNIYNIEYNHNTYSLTCTYDKKNYLEISKNISKRNYLNNVENIYYDPNVNNFQEHHIDIKYISKNIFALTITIFNIYNIFNLEYTLKINDVPHIIKIKKEDIECGKFTVFCHVNVEIIPILYSNFDYTTIIQTAEQNSISLSKFYSICTILSNVPYIKYKLFDKNDRINFINSNFPKILKYYNMLIPCAYKADLFRVLYLYKYGGIYFDCKNILFSDITFLINKKEIFVNDYNNIYISNGFIICIDNNNSAIKKYICHIIYNIHNKLKCIDSLTVTGPGLMGKYVNATEYLCNLTDGCEWQKSYICYINQIIIKNSYFNYYIENNYLNEHHYGVLWTNNNIYNNNKDNKYIDDINDKINGIEIIVWINLNRSRQRFIQMSEILKNINVKNIRINAIDGLNSDIKTTCNLKNFKKLSNYEIACTLSHLKAIYTIANYNETNGNYFMICEDDILFSNVNFFNVSINNIINKSPEFDILLLHHIYADTFNDTYIKWADYEITSPIASTACYIINITYAKKVSEMFSIDNNDNFIFKNNINCLDVSDVFIYKNARTYVYKYNYIKTIDEDSEIHSDNIEWHKKSSFVKDIDIINNFVIQ
jgi:GR25 family glycosyltransferase involved in LPS biosynthesis